MIIDKKGRIFGKLNIIDAFIIIVIIAAVVFAATRVIDSGGLITSSQKEYVIQYYAEEIPEFVGDKINVGDVVVDESKNIFMGTVTDIVIDESITFGIDSDGKVTKSTKEGYSSILLTTVGSATPFDNGIIIEGNKYGVGHSLTIRAGVSKLSVRIYDIKEKGAE